MNYRDLLQMYFERSTALQNYWTLYVVIIGGLLAVSSMRKRRDLVTAILVTVLFASFAYKNLGAIHDVTLQRMALLDSLKGYAGADTAEVRQVRAAMEPTLAVPDYEGVRNFHVICDILTILLYWAMEWRRARGDEGKGGGM